MKPEEVKQMIRDEIRAHIHNGVQATKNQLYDIFGHIQTVSAAPTDAPSTIYDQFQIYNNLLYWYDFGDNSWHNSGSSGTPASPDGSIQYNNAGVFGGSSTLLFNGTDTITFGAEDSEGRLVGPDATTSGSVGGNLTFQSGKGLGIGNGGSLTIAAGEGSAAGSNAGDIFIASGTAVAAAANAGNVFITGGDGPGFGGSVSITAGASGTNVTGGGLAFTAGAGGSTNGAGGGASLSGGPGGGSALGGTVSIGGGSGGGTAGNGGGVLVLGGTALAGNSNGGDVLIVGGALSGAGRHGDVLISGGGTSTTRNGGFMVIPTSAGAPTGTPANGLSIVYDTSNNDLYAYNGAWKKVHLA